MPGLQLRQSNETLFGTFCFKPEDLEVLTILPILCVFVLLGVRSGASFLQSTLVSFHDHDLLFALCEYFSPQKTISKVQKYDHFLEF